jgi:hypothetical protein
MSDSAQSEAKPINFPRTFVWAGVLIVFDAFFANQGVISAVVGLWMLLVPLPVAVLTTNLEQRRRRVARVAVFLSAVAIVFGLNWINNQIAQSRAQTLIAAIKAFRQEHQRYPEKLDELVPEFVEGIPVAKYTLTFRKFYYVATPNYHGLSYVGLPPFGRPTFKFERDAWGYVD